MNLRGPIGPVEHKVVRAKFMPTAIVVRAQRVATFGLWWKRHETVGSKTGYARDLMKPECVGAIARDYPRFRALLSMPFYMDLLDVCPRLSRQYLTTYLMRSFDTRERLVAAYHHYRTLHDLPRPAFIPGLLGNGIELWSREIEGEDYRMVIKQNVNDHHEGDILLILRRGMKMLFQMSFSLVPGSLIGMRERNVLFIGSAQGGKADVEGLRRAIKANEGVAPSHLVMAALRGVAQALGVDGLAGVTDADQMTKTRPNYYVFPFDYAAFWPMFGGEKNGRGVFDIPIEAWEKPLTEIPRSHRRRSRKKREYKAEVTTEIANALACYRNTGDVQLAEEKTGLFDMKAVANAPMQVVSGDVPLPF